MNLQNFKKKYVGDRAFYAYALGIAVPMILQNLITNFVSMLDNIMVGQVGTAQMSGVSIVNQFIFVFNLTVFGAVSGASIFGTQFFGKGDHEGQKYTVRFRLILVAVVTAVAAFILYAFDDQLITLFLSEDNAADISAQTLAYGKEYLSVILWSLIPFSLSQAYSSVLRECGETKIPMYGSSAAIGINLLLDYGLIFGKLGMPKMGVAGAALATVIAKCIEAGVIMVWAHTHPEKNKYIVGLFRGFYIPAKLSKDILIKGCPLLINEFLWSFGMAFISQCYSVRGIDAVAARNIASTLTNMFNVVFIQAGGCLGIIVGAKLGAGNMEEARDADNKMIFFSQFMTMIVALFMIPLAYLFPAFYNTEQSIKELSTYFILISALAMPIWSYTNSAYFTLRCGGKTLITFLFDFCSTWGVMLPLAFILSHYTQVGIRPLYAIVVFSELGKAIVGYFFIRSGMWMNNIVN